MTNADRRKRLQRLKLQLSIVKDELICIYTEEQLMQHTGLAIRLFQTTTEIKRVEERLSECITDIVEE